MDTLKFIGTFFAWVYCLSITAVVIVIVVAIAWPGQKDDSRRFEEVLSPDKKFIAVTEILDGGAMTSTSSYIIAIKSKEGEQKHIGYLNGLLAINVTWLNNHTIRIIYGHARKAIFEERFIELDKQKITIDVLSSI